MTMKKTKPKILFYDIETTPLQAWVWRCGEQYVRHPQLVEGYSSTDIICIGYEWLHSNEKGMLSWNYNTQNSKSMIKKFTKLCDEADLIIGKNNKRFDDKHMNTLRLKHGLEGRPDLLSKVDDLEPHMRKYFAFPSNTLDYVSKEFGQGGKDKMCFQDWIDIVTKDPKNGKKAMKKMLKYCGKDVTDTKNIWKHLEKHFIPKFNYSAYVECKVCYACGSKDIIKNGTRLAGKVRYQHYHCKGHGGYAGKETMKNKSGIIRG